MTCVLFLVVAVHASFWTIGEEVLGTLGFDRAECDSLSSSPPKNTTLREQPVLSGSGVDRMGEGRSILFQPRKLPLNRCRPVPVFTCRVPVHTSVVRSWVFLGVLPSPLIQETSRVSWCRPGNFLLNPPSLRCLKGIRGEKKEHRTQTPARNGESSSPRASRSSSHKGRASALLYVRYPRRRSVVFCRILPGRSMFLVPCIRSHESAGLMVVYVVTDQMVGDRRFPGATVLGEGGVETVCFLRQPSFPVPPTGREHLDGSWTVYEVAGSVHPDGFRRRGVPGADCRGSGNQHQARRRGVSNASCCGSSTLITFL